MAKKRAAVLSDTVSPNFYFPIWHQYYSRHFGSENLFVIASGPSVGDFARFDVGGVWRTGAYNNESRSRIVSQICDVLLSEYEYVLRVDTDEFLVPDPRKHESLASYLNGLKRPHVTAMGYNVLADPESASLDPGRSLFKDQRRHCYPYDALNKTCILSGHMVWSPGFHFASVYPEFDDLFLFHMKYADIDMQVAIGAAVAGQSNEARFQEYHRVARETLVNNLRTFYAFPPKSGWDEFERGAYKANFLNSVRFVKNWGGIYHGGPFAPDRVLLEIPDEFEGAV